MSSIDVAISKMRPPSAMKIICIDITNRCNLSCSNCTRLLENQIGYWDMSIDNFRIAARSLADFPGMIAVIGGNPCMHRNFEEICKVLEEEIPDKSKRGLWSNNVFKHTELVVKTFGGFNLNAHGDSKGIQSLREVRKLAGSKAYLYQNHSMHAPLLTAIKDLYGEEEMWEMISKCDINQNWSATIIENNGKLRAYFCEVAGSFDTARKEDYGLEVEAGWWRRSMESFSLQIKHFCPGCGAAARLRGTRDADEVDSFTYSNRDLIELSLKNRRVVNEVKRDELLPKAEKPITFYAKYDFNLFQLIRHRVRLRTRIRTRIGKFLNR